MCLKCYGWISFSYGLTALSIGEFEDTCDVHEGMLPGYIDPAMPDAEGLSSITSTL